MNQTKKKKKEFEQNKKYFEYVMNQKKEDDRIENIKKSKKNGLMKRKNE